MQKKIFTLLVLFNLIFLTQTSFGQNVIKVNIFSPLVRTGSFFYERAIDQNKSAQLGVFFTGFKAEGTKFSGYGVTPEFRYYLSSTDAPKGVYLGPFLRYQSFSLEEETTESKGDLNIFGGGLLIGKQWIFKDIIALDIFLGPSYGSGDVKVDMGSEEDFDTGAFNGFSVRTGLTLGINF